MVFGSLPIQTSIKWLSNALQMTYSFFSFSSSSDLELLLCKWTPLKKPTSDAVCFIFPYEWNPCKDHPSFKTFSWNLSFTFHVKEPLPNEHTFFQKLPPETFPFTFWVKKKKNCLRNILFSRLPTETFPFMFRVKELMPKEHPFFKTPPPPPPQNLAFHFSCKRTLD